MTIEQLYTGCLSQGTYYIESKGEVAIIDPLRDVQLYIDKATENNAKITHIFETHFHADFVSGHVTLSKLTGAPIIYGPNADPSFEATIAQDGQEFSVGDITIVALHTPGHTMESTTYLLRDEQGKDHALFSGDTLFLGDVGRPDLAQKMGEITERDLAGFLFDSLREKIMHLADDVIVYPAHGAGSACGKHMMKETVDTLGNQKAVNYALRADMTKEEFIDEVTTGLLPPPAYFPLNVALNKSGYEDLDKVISQGVSAIEPKDLEATLQHSGAILLDVRSVEDFVAGHVPRSLFIGLDGGFAPWVGALIANVTQPIVLVAPKGREKEAITRLARVGFDATIGYLSGGFEQWKNEGNEIDTVSSISPEQMIKQQNAQPKKVVDVRGINEYRSQHVHGAINTPLDNLATQIDTLPDTFFLHCAGGYRSMISASILKRRGVHNFIDIRGGFKAILDSDTEVTDFVCPSTFTD